MMSEKKSVGDKRLRKKDMINHLPNCLLCKILMYLPTKDAVKTSVLCHRWRNLWQSVPVLDMAFNCLNDFDKLAFLDKFIQLKGDLLLQRAKLKYLGYGCKFLNQTPINIVISQKIQHLDVEIDRGHDEVKIPPTIYTSCERLVSLKLCRASLPKLPKSVSLPCLKIMNLEQIKLGDSLDIEMLISVCPALETLTIDTMYGDKVSSQSLLSFCLTSSTFFHISKVVLETPKLKSLKLHYGIIRSFTTNDMSSIVELNLTDLILIAVNYPKLLTLISCVRDLTISFDLLRRIHKVLRSESRPIFLLNLSTLRVNKIMIITWEHFSIFLESCPNLKSLFLGIIDFRNEIVMLDVPTCVSSSLELVEVDGSYLKETYVKKVGSYFMENSALLKKFTLCVDQIKVDHIDLMKLKDFFTSLRRSKACEVVVRCSCLRELC